MSRHLVSLNTWEECRLTLIHEIAHALTPNDGGHGPAWAAKCVELGIPARRCYGEGSGRAVVEAEPRWLLYCPHCSNTVKRWRKTKGRTACRECCNKYTGGRFSDRYLMDWRYYDA